MSALPLAAGRRTRATWREAKSQICDFARPGAWRVAPPSAFLLVKQVKDGLISPFARACARVTA